MVSFKKNEQVISFTGSTAVGRHIGQVAAKSIKKVSLEVLLIMVNFYVFNYKCAFLNYKFSLVGREKRRYHFW